MNANVTKTPYYKERVKEIEKEILAIANNAPYADLSDNKAAYLLTLLNDRKGFLDAMFVVTPEEFARVNEVNERLRELSHELHNQVAEAHEKAKRAFFGKEFTVEATLKFVSTSDRAMIVRQNDDYYGSDFTKIMLVVDMLNEQGFIRPDFVDFDDCSNLDKELGTLDDITTYEDWQPAAEAFKGLDICFALHSLSAYHPYSIPDILRMRKFGLMINIRHRMPTISL